MLMILIIFIFKYPTYKLECDKNMSLQLFLCLFYYLKVEDNFFVQFTECTGSPK